jgi:hypothetical protein
VRELIVAAAAAHRRVTVKKTLKVASRYGTRRVVCDGTPGVSILCGPFWLRFTYVTPVLVTKY